MNDYKKAGARLQEEKRKEGSKEKGKTVASFLPAPCSRLLASGCFAFHRRQRYGPPQAGVHERPGRRVELFVKDVDEKVFPSFYAADVGIAQAVGG